MTDREHLIREKGNTYNASNSETNAIGDEGEGYFYNTMLAKGLYIVDVSKVAEYRLQDIDFVMYTEDFTARTIEVKWDRRCGVTGNIFVELSEDGWLNKCKADIIAYGDEANRLFYSFCRYSISDYLEDDECRIVHKPNKAKLVNIAKFEKWCKKNGRAFKTISVTE